MKSYRLLLLSGAAAASLHGVAFAQSGTQVDELVVTASRREETLSRVPLSVAAFAQEDLIKQRVTRIDDLSRVTPGLYFQRGGYGSARAPTPSIRGIGSNIGTGTTGIYIDDTPINVRFAANISSNLFPRLYDLERVEVLRGPQGTLFGASAMGGAIRFITPTPSLTSSRFRASAEISTMAGDQGYEVGAAGGGPIIQDKLGFNLSVFYRRDPGFVDHRDYQTKKIDQANSNWGESAVVHAAMKWQLNEAISITPSVLYQYEFQNDGNQYWAPFSNRDSGRFEHQGALRQPSLDRFYLPSLRINADIGFADFVSNTSFLYRMAHADPDYTQETNAIRLPNITNPPNLNAVYPYPGEAIQAYYRNKQRRLAQEFRLQSKDDGSRLRWVAGAFYSHLEQRDLQISTGTDTLDRTLRTYFNTTHAARFGGVPPYSAYGFNNIQYLVTDRPEETQTGVFGQVDFNLTEKLKLIAGLRYSTSKSSYNAFTAGPSNGGSESSIGSFKEHAWTPKFGVAYQIDEDNMVYANAAKGFRPGGAFPPVPRAFCGEDLANIGLTQSPATYNADSLWNYEVGSKNALFDRRLRIDAAAYYIKWQDIQRTVPLPICTLNYITNLGTVISKGVELSVTARPTDALTLTANIGYTQAETGETLQSSPRRDGTRVILTKEGMNLNLRPFTAAVAANYDFDLLQRPAYFRVDANYQGKNTVTIDPQVQGYNPLTAFNPKPYTLVKVRAGMTFDKTEVSVFADNLLDQHPVLTRGNYSLRSILLYETTLQPRTVGVRVDYRY
ncbi:TonB-dependent receptor [Phenylobacterium sp.]|jgi:iron complex outermembrane receptor protein|uniref:TonB-dependent receptor n=1 Tax=Phenylobacterium sp. TaxID=1871053 RepID=UPI0037848954